MKYKVSIGRKILQRVWVEVECDDPDQVEQAAYAAAHAKNAWEEYAITYSGMSVSPVIGDTFDILLDM